VHINRNRQSDSETALGAQTNAQEARPKRRWVFDSFSVQRAALACFGVLGTGGLLLLAGCPANLEDPGRFDIQVSAGGSSAGANTGGGSSTAGSGSSIDTTCLTAVFTKSCTTSAVCHLAGMPSASLDLSSPGVAARLIDVPATHGDVADGTGCMQGQKLVDTANPAASWLLLKINGGQGSCGSAMPIGPGLSTTDKACIQAFVDAAVKAAGTGSGAGGASAGSAGASAGSGGGTSAGTGGT
jgi:hypothetical protein